MQRIWYVKNRSGIFLKIDFCKWTMKHPDDQKTSKIRFDLTNDWWQADISFDGAFVTLGDTLQKNLKEAYEQYNQQRNSHLNSPEEELIDQIMYKMGYEDK